MSTDNNDNEAKKASKKQPIPVVFNTETFDKIAVVLTTAAS